jgi:hypothetical protein
MPLKKLLFWLLKYVIHNHSNKIFDGHRRTVSWKEFYELLKIAQQKMHATQHKILVSIMCSSFAEPSQFGEYITKHAIVYLIYVRKE